jgi:predicted double-glycine peptidase
MKTRAGFILANLWSVLVTIALMIGLVGCQTVYQDTKSEKFRADYGAATYTEVTPVRQSQQRSCGVACLSAVLNYWEKKVPEADLLRRYPSQGKLGYSLAELQQIATDEGCQAYALSFTQLGQSKPSAALSEQLRAGRPIIIAVKCPRGSYFGPPVPLIETWDQRAFQPLKTGDPMKHHYVVVIGENDRYYLVMDPAYGTIGPVQRQPLLDWWKDEGYAGLVVSQ